GTDHAEPAIVVDVRRFQAHAGELAHQVGFFIGQAGAAEDGEGIVAMLRLNALDGGGDAPDRTAVGKRTKSSRRRRIALVSMQQTVGMRALQVALDPLGAEHAAIERELLPRLETDYAIAVYFQLDAALLTAETTMRFD